jgi:hypothetical protein
MARVVCKPEVRFKDFTPAMCHILRCLVDIARSGIWPAGDIEITSANDGSHSQNPPSRHYVGEAVDIRSRDIEGQELREEWAERLQAWLGKENFMVLYESPQTENEHYHIQVRKGRSYP